MRFIRVEVGLIILLFAFIMSLFCSITIDPPWRLLNILEAHPNLYLSYVRNALLYLILPVSVGLAFSILGYIRERKSPTRVLDGWPLLMIIGGIFVFWAFLWLRFAYTSYFDAISRAHSWSITPRVAGIDNLILAVYATASVVGILWLSAGILFMLSPVFRKAIFKEQFKRA